MAKSMWINEITGELLGEAALMDVRLRARRAYHANTHIFEDEHEALAAFGVRPLAARVLCAA